MADIDPINTARARLAARIADPRVKMIGLADDLRALLDAIECLEQRAGVLASVMLSKHYWPDRPLHQAEWDELQNMSARARALYGIGQHEQACRCVQCVIKTITPAEETPL